MQPQTLSQKKFIPNQAIFHNNCKKMTFYDRDEPSLGSGEATEAISLSTFSNQAELRKANRILTGLEPIYLALRLSPEVITGENISVFLPLAAWW